MSVSNFLFLASPPSDGGQYAGKHWREQLIHTSTDNYAITFVNLGKVISAYIKFLLLDCVTWRDPHSPMDHTLPAI